MSLIDDLTPEEELRLKRYKNLRMFRDKNKFPDDAAIIEYIRGHPRDSKPKASRASDDSKPELTADEKYNKRYKELLKNLQTEFSVDMNNSNDRMQLDLLVKHILQSEAIDRDIRDKMSKDYYDPREIKALSDTQRSIVTSISEIQDRLGISRKQRKEKASDDVPQFISNLRKKALEFYQRKTVAVICETCQIELARYWLNFADQAHTIHMELECWKCHQKVVYVK